MSNDMPEIEPDVFATLNTETLDTHNLCPECGSQTRSYYENTLGLLCGRKGTTTECTKPGCFWSTFSGVMS